MRLKNVVLLAILWVGFTTAGIAQEEAKTIQLDQTTGAFTIQGLTLEEGNYIFEVENVGIDHKVGFVIAPKGQTGARHHIKEAYLAKTIKDGETSTSGVVKLEKGEYVYFCPLNPTPHYNITVQ